MKLVNEAAKIIKKAAKWRESASCIILSKNCINSRDSTDFKVLIFRRREQSSSVPTTTVFPGGVCENLDASPEWLKYFKSKGISEEQFRSLILKRNPDMWPQPGIFQTKIGDGLERDISLRITAIRETFEEMGILLCRHEKSLLDKQNAFGTYFEDFDRSHWQHIVHNDASQFLSLCQQFDVVPDLWSLNEWSVWVTPADKKKRFEAAFYLIPLENEPNIILEQTEGTDFMWLTPREALTANMNNEIVLAPPQLWELSRLLNFNELAELQKFAQQRAIKGTIRMQPSRFQCKDGIVSVLPGDSSYPNDPNTSSELISINMTKEEYRAKAEKLHRVEFKTGAYINAPEIKAPNSKKNKAPKLGCYCKSNNSPKNKTPILEKKP